MSNLGKALTLDLTVTNNLVRLIKCHLYHNHYGIQEVMGPLLKIYLTSDLNRAAERLIKSTSIIINQEVLIQKPSPYSK
ncbi:hypothetical protein IFM47457_11107 [Aspergillus lentulus]|nr:hypothetical protein IFM47457_11107 [Aspergillus lentulus]